MKTIRVTNHEILYQHADGRCIRKKLPMVKCEVGKIVKMQVQKELVGRIDTEYMYVRVLEILKPKPNEVVDREVYIVSNLSESVHGAGPYGQINLAMAPMWDLPYILYVRPASEDEHKGQYQTTNLPEMVEQAFAKEGLEVKCRSPKRRLVIEIQVKDDVNAVEEIDKFHKILHKFALLLSK